MAKKHPNDQKTSAMNPKRCLAPFLMAVLLCAGAAPAFALPPEPIMIAHGDPSSGVPQAPCISMMSVPGTTVQYNIQIAADSGFLSIVYDKDQASAQSFTEGTFTGQDGTIITTKDAYLGASTATFAFYSSVTYHPPLSANTNYWVRARVKDTSASWGNFCTGLPFTTGESAQDYPMNSASISNVVLSSPTAAGTMNVTFHIRENMVVSSSTFYGGAYNTADWIFVKFSTQNGASWTWTHAKLADGGSLTGSGAALTIASDKMGAYINHTQTAALWSSTVTLIWDYKTSGALVKDAAIVKVFTIPMTKVPTGSFVYNAGGGVYSGHNNYGGANQVTVGSADAIPTGAGTGWPNGYNSFYIMRYQVTQGLYTDFLNNVPYNWDGTGWDNYYYTSMANYGHKITYTAANPYGSKYSADYPNRTKNWMSNMDLWGFLNWAALRPMTEMEYQKASRDLAPDARKYPWGDEEPVAGTTTGLYTPPNEGGSHKMYYMNFGAVSGEKVLDAGRYMSGDAYRTTQQTGVSAYGIADLAGQAWQQMVYCSYLTAMTNGSGSYSYSAGNNWPPYGAKDAENYYYISFVGGSFDDDATFSVVSLRMGLGSLNLYTNRYYYVGGRGVRTP